MSKPLTQIVDGKRKWTKEGLKKLGYGTHWSVCVPDHHKVACISEALIECGLKGETSIVDSKFPAQVVFFLLPPHLFIRITRKGEVIIGKYDPDAVAEDDEMEENILEWVKDPLTLFESIRDTWDKVSAPHK